MSVMKIISMIVLVGLIGFAGYLIYLNFPGEEKSFEVTGFFEDDLPESNASSELIQFYPNMRFNHNDISYRYFSQCGNEKRDWMRSAFDEISEKNDNLITFYETTDSTPDIILSCSGESIREAGDTFIAGEGGPSKFYKLEPYSLIEEGEIVFNEDKSDDDCEKPIVELHELLHVFGYDHFANKDSVLYPYYSCKQVLDETVINDLIRLYSVEPKSEMSLHNVSANKSGRYLDFNIAIQNSGLVSADNVEVIVIATDKEVERFEMDTIDSGTTTILEIGNLNLPSRSVKKISFEVVTSSAEYSSSGNKVELEIEY